MDRIDSVSSSGAISKQPQKNTPQGVVSKKVTHVAPGTSETMVPMTKPECSDNIQKQLSSSRQSNFKSYEERVIAMKSIPELATFFSTFTTMSHAILEKTQWTKSVKKNLEEYANTMHLDFDSESKKGDYIDTLYKASLWMEYSLNITENQHLRETSAKTPQEKIDAYQTSIAETLISSEIFFKNSTQDIAFVDLVETIASFCRVNKEDEEENNKFIERFVFHFNNAKQSIAMGAADYKKIFNDFSQNIFGLLEKEHRNILSLPHARHCKLILELKKNGPDLINNFRRALIKINHKEFTIYF